MNTSSPNSRFAGFLERFQFERGIRWYGNVGYISLNNNVARIELTDRGCVGYFDRFNVQIINRAKGQVDSIDFRFDDYFAQSSRIDARNDMPKQKFHAWASSSDKPLNWYIAFPKSVDPITKAIDEYCNMFVF